MGLYLVILASEGDRPLKIPLLALGAVLVLIWLASMAYKVWLHFAIRKGRKSQLEEWTALARAHGFEVDDRGPEVVMRGTLAGRPFELDSNNFFTYGADTENALRFRIEDVDAGFSINGWNLIRPRDLQPASGDEAFDKRYGVHANEAGLRWIARFGPKERKLLVEFHEFAVDQRQGEVRIRMPYRLDSAHLDAAGRLIESVWGPAPDVTSTA